MATARAEGRRILLEPEGLIIAAALGLRVPRLVELRHESELRRLNAIAQELGLRAHIALRQRVQGGIKFTRSGGIQANFEGATSASRSSSRRRGATS